MESSLSERVVGSEDLEIADEGVINERVAAVAVAPVPLPDTSLGASPTPSQSSRTGLLCCVAFASLALAFSMLIGPFLAIIVILQTMVMMGMCNLAFGAPGMKMPARKKTIRLVTSGSFIIGGYIALPFIAHEPLSWWWWSALLGVQTGVIVWTAVSVRMKVAAELGVGDFHEWECVSQVDPDVAAMVIRDFDHACSTFRHMYPVQLQVLEVLAVSNRGLENDFTVALGDMSQPLADPNIKQLYHGTSAVGAKEIVARGFELPRQQGMFGKGIYFASTPLKSWQYSTTGYMLLCDVALGRERQMGQADINLSLEDLRRTVSTSFAYDSVVGTTRGDGGTLRLPEWVVYKTTQAVPKYLLKVQEQTTATAIAMTATLNP